MITYPTASAVIINNKPTITYELKKYENSEVEDSGAGNILEHMIDIVIEPKERGKYQLKFTYRIADEILIETIGVDVI